MLCPREVADIIAEVLRTGLLRIRLSDDARRSAVEADHLHNLPALLTDYRHELLDFYWRVERIAFIRDSSREDMASFEPLWAALAEHVAATKNDGVPTP